MIFSALIRAGRGPGGYLTTSAEGGSGYTKKRHCLVTKTVRVMKITAILLLAGAMQVSASAISQNITFEGKNARLTAIFSVIEKQTGYLVVANKKQVGKAAPVTIDADNMPLQEFMSKIIEGQPLVFSIEGNTIFIREKEQVAGLSPRLTLDVPPITGVVTNAEGQPLAGASVKIKGSNAGVVTDSDGKFTLEATAGQTLIISYVGYADSEISAKEGNNIIRLIASNNPLDEVIFKGYYGESRKLSTGSVVKVNSEQINKQPVTNPLQALQGRAPGVYIQQVSGIPGSGFNIQIRGQNSLRPGGSLPLYVIDGVPFSSSNSTSPLGGSIIIERNPLNSISPADIEAIEILKDADATAIYGSRGANGVVLVTTKKGRKGKTKVDLNVYSGVENATRLIKLLDTRQYLEMRNEAFANDGATPTLSNAPDLLLWDTTKYTDWQKVLIGNTANINNFQASASGGNSSTQFLLSTNYLHQTTVFPGDFRYQKGSANLNINHLSENKKFRISLSANYTVDKNTLPTTDLSQAAIFLLPLAPDIYDQEGKLNWENGTWDNPFAALLRKYENTGKNLITNASVSYQLIKDVSLKVNFGYNDFRIEEKQTTPLASQNPDAAPQGMLQISNGNTNTWIIEPQAEFSKSLGLSKFDVLGGVTFQENRRNQQGFRGTGYNNDELLSNLSAAPEISSIGTEFSKYRYNAVFGRIGYTYNEKYIVNLTGRRDGSSRFGKDRQFGNFGAVGLGWIFTNERFLAGSSVLSFGKIRGSYGTTGNDQIGDYQYFDTYTPTIYPYDGGTALVSTRLANPDFAWETNRKLEFAIQLGFFKDRLLASVSHYRQRTSNQLVGLSLPELTGFSEVQFNLPAVIQNTGWEFEFNSTNISTKNFQWNTGFNLSVPRNKLIEYPNIEASSYATSYAVGRSLYVQYQYHVTGVDSQTGIYTFEDLDSSGNISVSADRQFLKEIAINFHGGLQNSVKYRNFELDLLFQFVKQTGSTYLRTSTGAPGTRFGNQPELVMERWRKPGDDANIQRFTQSNPAARASTNTRIFGDATVDDASFIRLKNLTFSYHFPTNLMKKIKLDQGKIFLQGQNLLTITDYLGSDPEFQSLQVLPPMKTIVFGVQLTL